MRTGFLLVLVLLVAGAVPALAQEERVLRVPYDASAPGPFLAADVPNPTPFESGRSLQVGGTTVEVEPEEVTVEVFLLDDSHRRVPGRLVLYDAAGSAVGFHDFCFHTLQPIPEGTVEAAIYASPLIMPCPVEGLNYGPATRGEMVISFTRPSQP